MRFRGQAIASRLRCICFSFSVVHLFLLLLSCPSVLYAAPYEVTETGWGEFVIGITINFHDVSGLDPIQLSHTLKLFPGNNLQPTTKRPVMSEVYDEFVFVNPTKEWFDMLHSGPVKKVDHHPLMPYCPSRGRNTNGSSSSAPAAERWKADERGKCVFRLPCPDSCVAVFCLSLRSFVVLVVGCSSPCLSLVSHSHHA